MSLLTGKTFRRYTHTQTQSHTSRKLGESLFSSAMLPAVSPPPCYSWVERAEHYQQGANKNTKIKQDGAVGHVITNFYDVAQEEGSGGGTIKREKKHNPKERKDGSEKSKIITFYIVDSSIHSRQYTVHSTHLYCIHIH